MLDISVSLDGFVAGPNATLDAPLGEGGELLHEWALATRAWREPHGQALGEAGVDDDVVRETVEAAGAYIMGRRMFSGGAGPWEADPRAGGWWGDEPPYHAPVFVLAHRERADLPMEGGTTFHFVTDGIHPALERARATAGDRNVAIAGGPATVNQFLAAGLIDELRVHVTPTIIGAGERLFDGVPPSAFVQASSRGTSLVTHLVYRPVC